MQMSHQIQFHYRVALRPLRQTKLGAGYTEVHVLFEYKAAMSQRGSSLLQTPLLIWGHSILTPVK